ncbi:hypothetical protein HOK51_06895 [Candidatus Woesearchaeota archaeon]|jgi:hypothetical protein|nr:hypothetical protein [Candidatus Woesearchaeota archaeon]MBT6519550.1 hypothetical protein [Candidatus Woesearchaeota archaeon]MBT7367705.1 hypothetical protein [Candidatus Woesearchaeota archaeon]
MEQTSIEQTINNIFSVVKATKDLKTKEQLMLEAGDLRREQYLGEINMRKKAEYRDQARNCYFAARGFYRKQLSF